MAIGMRPQFPAAWTSPQGILGVLTAWLPASPRPSDPRENKAAASHALEVTRCHFCHRSHRTMRSDVGGDVARAAISGGEIAEATLEAGYCGV